MNPLYRIWWRLLMDLRPITRYTAERLPRFAPAAVRLRTLAHFATGNVLQVLVSVYGLAVWTATNSFRWGFIAWATAAISVELVFQFTRARSNHPVLVRLVGWREAWRIRRRWPADWSIVAAKTTRVQAEVGTSKEPIASATLRPIADHPKMSWWPRIEWPVVSWWVGPPPGRSFIALEDVAGQLAANMSHCIDVAVDFDRESDSYGRLVVTFADPLQATITPTIPAIDAATEWPAAPSLALVPDVDEWEGY